MFKSCRPDLNPRAAEHRLRLPRGTGAEAVDPPLRPRSQKTRQARNERDVRRSAERLGMPSFGF